MQKTSVSSSRTGQLKNGDEFLQTADIMNQFKQGKKRMICILNMLIK
jgi:hypothetical protein